MTLVGECNRCGLCCMQDGHRCIYLAVDGKPGEPNATRCTAYERRYDGMPIAGVDANGKVKVIGVCRKDSPKETQIIAQFIGKGCSLTRKE